MHFLWLIPQLQDISNYFKYVFASHIRSDQILAQLPLTTRTFKHNGHRRSSSHNLPPTPPPGSPGLIYTGKPAGGFMIAMCMNLVPAQHVEIMIPLYEFPNAKSEYYLGNTPLLSHRPGMCNCRKNFRPVVQSVPTRTVSWLAVNRRLVSVSAHHSVCAFVLLWI